MTVIIFTATIRHRATLIGSLHHGCNLSFPITPQIAAIHRYTSVFWSNSTPEIHVSDFFFFFLLLYGAMEVDKVTLSAQGHLYLQHTYWRMTAYTYLSRSPFLKKMPPPHCLPGWYILLVPLSLAVVSPHLLYITAEGMSWWEDPQ